MLIDIKNYENIIDIMPCIDRDGRYMIMIGFDRKKLNTAFYRLVHGTGIISIIASFALSGIVFLFVNFTAVKLLVMLLIPFIESITLLIASNISNKRLWRK